MRPTVKATAAITAKVPPNAPTAGRRFTTPSTASAARANKYQYGLSARAALNLSLNWFVRIPRATTDTTVVATTKARFLERLEGRGILSLLSEGYGFKTGFPF